MGNMQSGNTRHARGMKSPVLVVIGIVLVLVLVLGAVLFKSCGAQDNDPNAGAPTKPIQAEDVLDTDVKTLEQLQELMLMEEDLEITLNVDLDVDSAIKVVGNKTITGTGKLTAVLGGRDTYSLFEVSNGASLTMEGLYLDGNASADGITVQGGGKADIKNVTIVWPYQYGVAAYDDTTLENVSIDNSPTAAVLVSSGNVTVKGGEFTNSHSLTMYVENSGNLTLTDEPVLDGSAKHGITNRGTLTVESGTFTGCAQYAIVNYGALNIAYGGTKEDGFIDMGNNDKGGIYNYASGTVEAKDLYIHDSGNSGISNQGTMTLTGSTITDSGTNGIYNAAVFNGEGLTISNAGNCGVYNVNPGKLTLTDSSIEDSVKRGVHNKGGKVELDTVNIQTCGTHGIANTVDDFKNAGTLTAKNISVSGAKTNVYNEAAGVKTTITDSTLAVSSRSNVVVAYGTMTLTDTRIQGSRESGTCCVNVAEGAKATVSGCAITGGAKQGFVNHGTATVTGGSITNHSEYAIVNDGTLTVKSSGSLLDVGNNGKGSLYNYEGATVTATGLNIHDNGGSSVSNNGTMKLTDSKIDGSGTNGIYNAGTFTGSNLTVADSGNCGVYNINDGELTLSKSVITDSEKRGVHNAGGAVTINTVTIDTCGSHGIANTVNEDGKAGTITAKTVTVCNAKTNVYNEGSGVTTEIVDSTLKISERTNVVVTYGTMTLKNTDILGSEEDGTYALQIAKGAVCTVSGNGSITGAASRGVTNHGTLTISGGEIYGNNSAASGGGVFTDGTLYITGGSIYNNTANGAGGGVSVGYSSSDPELVGKLYMTDGKIYNNTATGNGGGIYISKGTSYNGGETTYCYASVTGGSIYDNTAQKGTAVMYSASGEFGGKVSIGSESDVCINKDVVLTVTALSEHNALNPVKITATGAAGTVVMEAEDETTAGKVSKAIASTLSTIGFEQQGKQIVINAGEYVTTEGLDMTGATITEVSGFQALKAAVEGTASDEKQIIKLTDDINMEGTITVPAGATVMITDNGNAVTLLRDETMTSGAFFDIPDSAKLGLQGTVEGNLILDGNNANVEVTEASSSLLTNKGELYVQKAVLQNNYSSGATLKACYGGLIYAPNGIVNVTDSVLSGGYATNGGAIFISGAQVTLTDTEISNCTASASGGAIRYQGGILKINGGSVKNNTGSAGGAIATDNGVILTVEGTIFEANATTGGHGGAITMTNSCTLEATNVTFRENHTEGNGSYYGGALALNVGTTANLESCVFDGNYSSHEGNNNGGAIYAGKETQVTVSGTSEFKNNHADTNGGAIYGNNDAKIVVGEGTTFTKNTAANGGAAYVIGYTLEISGAEFNENGATGSGGAFYVKPGDTDTILTISGSTFTKNTSDGYGGVINVAGAGSTVSFTDCTFTANTAKSGNEANTLMVSGSSVLSVKNITITAADASVGDVRINAKGVLNIAGQCSLGKVMYAANTSKMTVTEALTEGSAMTVLPAAYTEGDTVVTGADAAVLANAVQYMSVVNPTGENWIVGEDGKLVNNTKQAFIGTTGYDTLADAIAAAQSGSEITLNSDVSENVTVPAGVTIDGNGKTVTGNVTLVDTAVLKNVAVSGNVTLQGDTDLSTVTVSGTVTVPADKTVTVGGSFDADTVELAAGATIQVASALGQSTTVNVTTAVQTDGTTILTGDASVLATEYEKFNVALSDGTLALAASGKIESVPFKALIGDDEYDTLEAAITAAAAGDTIRITNNYTVSAQIEISKKLTVTSATTTTCTVSRGSGNTAGAVFNITADGDLTLGNITVDGNDISATCALIENYGTFTLSADATLTQGKNTAQAGGLDNQSGGQAKIYGTICDCTGKNGGGARNYDGATMNIYDGAVFEDNTATANGGAIHQSGIFTAGKATFRNNVAEGSYSGAIHVGSTGSTELTGTVFTGNSMKNTDSGSGGVMYISGGGAATVENISVTGNGNTVAVAKNGGAILVGKDATLTVNGTQNEFRDLKAASGGAIYNNGGTVTIAGGTFTNISSTGSGGVIYSIINSGVGNVTINGGTFTNNSSGGVGGVINTSGKVTITVNGGTFTGNTAATNGGAIHVSGSGTLVVTGGTFSGNYDQNDPDVDIWLNNKTSAVLDLTNATAETVTFGLVSGTDFANNTSITNPNGVPLNSAAAAMAMMLLDDETEAPLPKMKSLPVPEEPVQAEPVTEEPSKSTDHSETESEDVPQEEVTQVVEEQPELI